MIKRCGCFTAAVLTLYCGGPAPLCAAQVPLQIGSETAALPIPAGFLSPAMGNGGIYLEFSSQVETDRAIHWFSADGKEQHVYSYDSIRSEKRTPGATAEVATYEPTPSGLAALMVWHDKEGVFTGYTIEEWFQSGTYRNSIPVPSWFSAMHIASFDNGSYLVLGGTNSDTGLKSEAVLILDAQGKVEMNHLIRKLDDPDHPLVPDTSAAVKESSGSASSAGGGASAKGQPPDTAGWLLYNRVATMQTAQGGDGYVYLAEEEATGKVYRVSRVGVVEELPLRLPPELTGQHAIVLASSIKGGVFTRLLAVVGPHIEMNKPLDTKARYIVANSTNSGDVLRFYELPKERVSDFPVDLDGDDLRFLCFTRVPDSKVPRKTIVTLSP